MITFSPLWLEVVSELLVNLSAGWFAVIFIEPQIEYIRTIDDLLLLTTKFGIGMLTLYLSKRLREEVRYGRT